MANGEAFYSACTGGETEGIDESTIRHKCGFHASASYGTLGVWAIYKRFQVPLKLTGGAIKFNWWRDWDSEPNPTGGEGA